jgi:hypothetical protein
MKKHMRRVRRWFRSRTINTAALIATLGAIEASQGVLQTLLGPKQFGYVIIGLALVMAYLRSVTKKPLEEKTDA